MRAAKDLIKHLATLPARRLDAFDSAGTRRIASGFQSKTKGAFLELQLQVRDSEDPPGAASTFQSS